MTLNAVLTRGMFHEINHDVGNNASSPTKMRLAITLSVEHKSTNCVYNQSGFSPTIRGSVITVSVAYADIDSIQNNSRGGADRRGYDTSKKTATGGVVSDSPANDQGSNALVNRIITDMRYTPRILFAGGKGKIDLGTYE